MKSTIALLFALITTSTYASDVCFIKVSSNSANFHLDEEVLYDRGYQVLQSDQELEEGDYLLEITEQQELIKRSYTYRDVCVTWHGPGVWSERNCTRTGKKPYSIKSTFTLKTSKVQRGRNVTVDVASTHFTKKFEDRNYDKYNKLLTKALSKCRRLN